MVLSTGNDQNRAVTATNAPMMRVKLAVREVAPLALSAALAGVLELSPEDVSELTLEVPSLEPSWGVPVPVLALLVVWATTAGVGDGGGTLCRII
jgi:hypothetical protein